MMRRRDPGTQLPMLINPHDSAPEMDAGELRALLEAFAEGLKRWDCTDNPPAADAEAEADKDIRELMSESIARYSELGIRVEFRTP